MPFGGGELFPKAVLELELERGAEIAPVPLPAKETPRGHLQELEYTEREPVPKSKSPSLPKKAIACQQ